MTMRGGIIAPRLEYAGSVLSAIAGAPEARMERRRVEGADPSVLDQSRAATRGVCRRWSPRLGRAVPVTAVLLSGMSGHWER